MYLFGRNCDHDYYFELLLIGRPAPLRQISRCSTAHHDDVRAVPSANRTCSTADNPIPDASSCTGELPACGPPSPHRQVEILAAPLGNTAQSHMRRFHQQETHHRSE